MTKDFFSASKWNTDFKDYNKKYTEPFGKKENDGKHNTLLTQNVSLAIDTRKTRRNNNILLIDEINDGNNVEFVKANLLQINRNFAVIDVGGEILKSTGTFLKASGYEIKVFDMSDPEKSCHYNPLNYVQTEQDITNLINNIIKNTRFVTDYSGDPFWEKAEECLLQTLIMYIVQYQPKYKRNLLTVLDFLHKAYVDKSNPTKKTELEETLNKVATENPDSVIWKKYLMFKMGSGKMSNEVVTSAIKRLETLHLTHVEQIITTDEMELQKMGIGKKALFIIVPPVSKCNFIVPLMCYQLFDVLFKTAKENENQQLKTPVHFFLNKFTDIGILRYFSMTLATMRKHLISCTISIPNLAKLKTSYKDDWESLVGNCDSLLFFNSKEYGTVEYVSKELGKKEIKTRIGHISKTARHSTTIREKHHYNPYLMEPDEIINMDKNLCILLIRGMNPFKDIKLDFTKHKHFPYTGDANKNLFYL